jgi:hypothetical protein
MLNKGEPPYIKEIKELIDSGTREPKILTYFESSVLKLVIDIQSLLTEMSSLLFSNESPADEDTEKFRSSKDQPPKVFIDLNDGQGQREVLNPDIDKLGREWNNIIDKCKYKL